MADALPPVLERMLDLWNGATDLDPAEIYAAGCLTNGGPESFEPAEIIPTVATWRAAFPDLCWNVEEWFSAGDRYVLRLRAAGTHTGTPFTTAVGTAEAAGRRIDFNGLEVFEVRDDRIVDVWIGWNTTPLLAALGATL
jgi:hypothetical protein